MKTFHVPITHEFIQNLTELDLEFIDWSAALDNPKVYDKVKNTYYDDDFDEYEKEVEDDELTEEELALFGEEKSESEVDITHGIKTENLTHDEDYASMEDDTVHTDIDNDDWEEVE